MKLDTTARQLRRGLGLFKGIISRRVTIPILSTVLIGDGKFRATDLDCEVWASIPTSGPIDGAAALDWFALSALARVVDPDETMSLSAQDAAARIAFNGAEYGLPSLPAGDYPEFRGPNGATTATGNLRLIEAIRRVAFALSEEETRYYLNGVAFLVGPDGTAMVCATNGHMLAMAKIGAMPDGAAGAIVPRHVVAWLCGHAEPESVIFDQAGNRARFDWPGMGIAFKLIDGNFPDIFKVIPCDLTPVFSADRLALLRLVRRMLALAPKRAPHVKISGSECALVFTFGSAGTTARETLAIEPPVTSPFEIGFNLGYLAKVLSRLGGDTVTFSRSAASGWQIAGSDDALTVLLMPCRV